MTYLEKMRKMADEMEALRLEIFQNVRNKATNKEDKDDIQDIDDSMFKMQSDLRNMAIVVAYINDEDVDD